MLDRKTTTIRKLGGEWRLALATATFAAAAVLAACGGGGDSTPAATTAATPTFTTAAPTGSTSFALGAVTGFGSVIVGGVRYDDSKAAVVSESGVSLALSAVKLGSLVQVDGAAVDRSAGTGTALRFTLCDALVGPVASINSAASTFVVLGQTVLVTADTVFDSTLSGGLSALKTAAVIAVSGSADATTGVITATRIEPSTATAYQLRGTVTSLDTTAKTFKIGAATVSYAGLAAASVPSTLANGVVVSATLSTTVGSGGAWTATALRIAGDRKPFNGSSDTHLEGAITVFTSSSSFEIGGVKVDASAATFPDGTAGVVLGARVEVNGTTNAAGVLVATTVALDDHGKIGGQRAFELHGTLSALDTTALTFVLRGVTVSYAGSVTYSGGTAADLANGKSVDVYGVLSANRTQLAAQRIAFKSS